MNQVGEVEMGGLVLPVFYSERGKYYYVWKHAGEDGKYPQIIDYQKEIINEDDTTNTILG